MSANSCSLRIDLLREVATELERMPEIPHSPERTAYRRGLTFLRDTLWRPDTPTDSKNHESSDNPEGGE